MSPAESSSATSGVPTMAVAAGRSSFIRAARRTPGEGRGLGLGSELGSGLGLGPVLGSGRYTNYAYYSTLTTLTTRHLLRLLHSPISVLSIEPRKLSLPGPYEKSGTSTAVWLKVDQPTLARADTIAPSAR